MLMGLIGITNSSLLLNWQYMRGEEQEESVHVKAQYFTHAKNGLFYTMDALPYA